MRLSRYCFYLVGVVIVTSPLDVTITAPTKLKKIDNCVGPFNETAIRKERAVHRMINILTDSITSNSNTM